jgi:hypothetical protein
VFCACELILLFVCVCVCYEVIETHVFDRICMILHIVSAEIRDTCTHHIKVVFLSNGLYSISCNKLCDNAARDTTLPLIYSSFWQI